MSWIDVPGFERRPLVFVEDHLYHTSELLKAMASTRPDLLAETTVCAVDRAGPDTDAAIHEWTTTYPALQIVASGGQSRPSVQGLLPGDTTDAAAFARMLARAVRPGGILVQDIHLDTLPFVPADRWWESIYVAATVRGLFAAHPPTVRFLSNKRGYSATFGRELADAGFDPRDVMDKTDLDSTVMPTLASLVDHAFPDRLTGVRPPTPGRSWRVGPLDQRDVDDAFDVVVWTTTRGIEIGGQLVRDPGAAARVVLKPGSHEAATWRALVADRLADHAGLPVVSVGDRIGPPGAGRAELTNLAARHIHTLRARLTDATAIVTADHAYRFADGVRVAVHASDGTPGVRGT